MRREGDKEKEEKEERVGVRFIMKLRGESEAFCVSRRAQQPCK